MRLTVMSFNVRGSYHEDGVNNWHNRRDLNVATLHKYAPDMIGFQEAQNGNLDTYATALSAYDVELGLISIRQAENYHRVPIYWKRERFEKIESGGFYLSETPEVWSLSWGSTLHRAVTWVKLREIATQTEFIVCNSHFPHEQETDLARAESAKLIVRRMATYTEHLPVIVMGDFNARPHSAAYNVFMDAGYVDTYLAAGHTAEVNTYHHFMGKLFQHSGLRLDWILTKHSAQRFITHAHTVITDEARPVYPSDHYPIQADVELILN